MEIFSLGFFCITAKIKPHKEKKPKNQQNLLASSEPKNNRKMTAGARVIPNKIYY